ncbi:hypothetical protein SynWH8101_2056 [Synechococcus sp. WH 8101]|uniref:DUF6561 domain-containing protein n=1 Tax=Synechococcus sp. WH 8101 TaxID=59932 RepID=UPI00102341D1|nr:DUF6561 domain-containing protein [Synechococcus sp. WH 8101]QBE69637.1 hypothetical protein SynWH8101_2056 [Synechococcus sp. WH 8101]
MPGPVVNGVRHDANSGGGVPANSASGVPAHAEKPFLPLLAEGTIRLVLLTSGQLLIARLRQTSDRDGERAYQLLRPLLVKEKHPSDSAQPGSGWILSPFLAGLSTQENLVLFKAAVASVLNPEPRLLHAYTIRTNQECPPEETPVERLKRAFEEFTESLEGG